MFDFFSQLFGYIEVAFNFLLNIVESTITLISTLPNAISTAVYLVGFLPSFIGSCVIAVIAVGVVKLMIGRS